MTPLLTSGGTDPVRKRLRRDGYIYLPRFLDVEDVVPVQADVRWALHEWGWLADPSSLVVAGDREPRFTTQSFPTVYPVLQRLESFHRLAHSPRLLELMASLLEEEIFCHPAKVLRISLPTTRKYSTGAHQDFVKLHVEADVLTAWIPLTACTAQRQGVRILADSHRDGFRPTDPTLGRSLPVYLPIDADDPRWLTADYEVGDVVVFHSLTVHGGGPNTSDSVRLSADVRYQRRADPMRSEYVHPHGWPGTPDWPELCAGWSTDRWVRMPPGVSLVPMPTDVSYAEFISALTAPPSRLLGY